VTSGSYQRYYTLNGIRYHHIIHPDTLMPHHDYLSVSILSENSALADALSTAIFNMDYISGSELIRSLENVEAIWIFADGSIHKSDGFSQYVIN